MCSSDGVDPLCVSSFKAAACFPYCMAVHVRGSGSQPMVLHSADEWHNGVFMLNRVCGDPANSTSSNQMGATGVVLMPSSPYGLNGVVDPSANCSYSPTSHAFLPKSTRPDYELWPSVDLPNQPFAFLGDAALTAQQGALDASGNPTWSIGIQRLWGAGNNEFTVVNQPQLIRSTGPCTNPSDCGNVDLTCASATGCQAAIPYRSVFFLHRLARWLLSCASTRLSLVSMLPKMSSTSSMSPPAAGCSAHSLSTIHPSPT